MKLRLPKLQNNDKKTTIIRSAVAELPEDWEDDKKVF